MQKDEGAFAVCRRFRQHGDVAIGVQAVNDSGTARSFDAQALGADTQSPIAADARAGAHTPDVRPPRTARGRAHDAAAFAHGPIPRRLRSHAQFAVSFVAVVVTAQRVDQAVGLVE